MREDQGCAPGARDRSSRGRLWRIVAAAATAERCRVEQIDLAVGWSGSEDDPRPAAWRLPRLILEGSR
jgi:hypothetical protein